MHRVSSEEHTHAHAQDTPSPPQPIIYMTKLQWEVRGSPVIMNQADGTCCVLTLGPRILS